MALKNSLANMNIKANTTLIACVTALSLASCARNVAPASGTKGRPSVDPTSAQLLELYKSAKPITSADDSTLHLGKNWCLYTRAGFGVDTQDSSEDGYVPAHRQIYAKLSKSELGNSFKSEFTAFGIVLEGESYTYNFSPEATSNFREMRPHKPGYSDDFAQFKKIVRSIDDSHLIIGRFVGKTTYSVNNTVTSTNYGTNADDAPGIPDFKIYGFDIFTLAKDGDNCRKNPLTGTAHLQRDTLSNDVKPSLNDIISRHTQGNPYACSEIKDLLLANAKKDELIYPEVNQSDLEMLVDVTKVIIDGGQCTK